ncbi:sugar nucleotidyltransferase [Natrarchaeobius halalkaliphilus]|uniref:Sugar nucleotidyltransferase n=1 Tax=Natrarchaeobius halalkaliphilus TaxID=1679091 RepID=A0A3N6N4D9_9EURY|nr:sugar phosphate nucleotidyltransferase [Natrarchaeobius halalkaliphilus]RQG93042.1 sugar nucleotidyltransferase [Natrarchaeobius halalkaliphilus]
MHAIVPAAGEGTRLRPLTSDRPKGLLEVDNRPILSHCFDRLCEVGVTVIVVVIGYRGAQIVDYYGDCYGEAPIRYVRQPERKGLAHAIAQAADAVEGDVLVCNGDNVFGTSLESVVETRRRSDVDAALLVERASPAVARTTGVVVTDESGTVTELVEKPDEPPSTLVTTGVYALPESIFEHCRAIAPSDRGEYELPDAIARLREHGGVVETVELEGWRVNVNTEADLSEAERKLR